MKTVDFYFDYLSPYAYLASLEVEAVCSAHGAVVRCRPVLFAALLAHWGQLGPAEIPPKAVHVFKDCIRYARTRGLPFRAPKLHPFNPLLALRVTCAAADDAEAFAIAQALFALGWARGGDLADAAALAAALDAAGLPGRALLERAQSPEVKAKLREQSELAIARGVFGVPTAIIDEELFWGRDQLPNLALYLAGRDPLEGIDWRALAPQSAGVSRRRP